MSLLQQCFKTIGSKSKKAKILKENSSSFIRILNIFELSSFFFINRLFSLFQNKSLELRKPLPLDECNALLNYYNSIINTLSSSKHNNIFSYFKSDSGRTKNI